jgi:hypothetical protein
MSDLALTLNHPNIKDHGSLHQEIKQYPSSHRRGDITSTPQEHPSLHDPSPVYAHPPDSTAGSFNAELYQPIDILCNDQFQPRRTSPSCACDYGPLMDPLPSLGGNFFLHLHTVLEECGATPAMGPMSEADPFGGMPTLSDQFSRTNFDPGHDPIAPPLHPSGLQLAAHVHQHISTASVPPNQGVVVNEDLGSSCIICGRKFHAKRALNRHMDDVHSKRKRCHRRNCSFTYIGKRKLQNHLHKVHGEPLPTRSRSASTRKVAVPDSTSYSMPLQLSESVSTSTSISTSGTYSQ